jgi:hypothetical protein
MYRNFPKHGRKRSVYGVRNHRPRYHFFLSVDITTDVVLETGHGITQNILKRHK